MNIFVMLSLICGICLPCRFKLLSWDHKFPTRSANYGLPMDVSALFLSLERHSGEAWAAVRNINPHFFVSLRARIMFIEPNDSLSYLGLYFLETEQAYKTDCAISSKPHAKSTSIGCFLAPSFWRYLMFGYLENQWSKYAQKFKKKSHDRGQCKIPTAVSKYLATLTKTRIPRQFTFLSIKWPNDRCKGTFSISRTFL